MQVKILKPVSSGVNEKTRAFAKNLPAFYEPGETIDFKKDMAWPPEKPLVEIEAKAKQIEEAGYIKILKAEKKPKAKLKKKNAFEKLDEIE